MNTDLVSRVQQINPAPPGVAVPDGAWTSEKVLEEVRRRTTVPASAMGSRFKRPWLVVAVAAAATLLLVGGLALLIRPNRTNAPPVIDQLGPDEPSGIIEPIPTPRSTEDIAPGVESGTPATPAGDARWVHLSGDASALPGPGSVALPWPTGFAILERPEVAQTSINQFEVIRPARLWVSPDGGEWRIEPIPAPDDATDVSLTLADGVYWLISANPNRLWRSSDGEAWEEYDTAGLESLSPAGLGAVMWRHTPPVTAGDLTLFHADFVGVFPAQAFGIAPECAERALRIAPGVYQLTGDEECPRGGPVLRFVETETGLQVLDDATGEELGEILGANLSHMEMMTQTDESRLEGLFSVGDGQVTAIEPPWPRAVSVRLMASEGGIYAYVVRYEVDDSFHLSIWRTDDGRSWTDLGPPSFLADEPQTRLRVSDSLTDPLTVAVYDPTSEAGSVADNDFAVRLGLEDTWEVGAGVTWTPAPAGRPDQTSLVRLESGWFATNQLFEEMRIVSGGSFPHREKWWMHVDGTWVSLADLGMEPTGNESGCVHATAIENTTFFLRTDCSNSPSSTREVWVLTFERSG